jgi:hypothetical protein
MKLSAKDIGRTFEFTDGTKAKLTEILPKPHDKDRFKAGKFVFETKVGPGHFRIHYTDERGKNQHLDLENPSKYPDVKE